MTDTLVHPTKLQRGLPVPRLDSAQSRRVVIAVDGSGASIEALVWARDVLMGAGDSLCAVTGFTPPPCMPEAPATAEAMHQSAECARIAAELAIRSVFGADEPGRVVEHVVGFGSIECLALRESASADLIVVGSQPHRGFLGRLRSSSVKRLARHAICPVVLVPAGSERSAA